MLGGDDRYGVVRPINIHGLNNTMTTRLDRVLWIDVSSAVLFACLFVWAIYTANEAVADALRRYGHNVDSGALVWAAGILYFAPVAFLFGAAALCIRRRWKIMWVAHWLAVTCAVVPILVFGGFTCC